MKCITSRLTNGRASHRRSDAPVVLPPYNWTKLSTCSEVIHSKTKVITITCKFSTWKVSYGRSDSLNRTFCTLLVFCSIFQKVLSKDVKFHKILSLFCDVFYKEVFLVSVIKFYKTLCPSLFAFSVDTSTKIRQSKKFFFHHIFDSVDAP